MPNTGLISQIYSAQISLPLHAQTSLSMDSLHL